MPKLTQRIADAAHYEGRELLKGGWTRHVIWDDSLGGFGLRVYPPKNGTKAKRSFILSYRGKDGKKKLYTIGSSPPLKAEKARELAEKKRAELIDGNDPLEARRQERAELQSGDTVEAIATLFMERYVNARGRKTAYEFQRIIDREIVPHWGKNRIGDITKRDASRLLHDIAARAPVMSNRVRSVARRMFGWACECGVIEVNPFDGTKMVGEESSRDRVLEDAELTLVWEAAGDLSSPYDAFLRTLMLCGQRRGEVAAMTWDEIDLENDKPTWTLAREATKSDRRHVVPLSPQLVRILEQMPRNGDGYVFGYGKGNPIVRFSAMKRRLDERITVRCEDKGLPVLEPWRLHDLRRSAASGMARLNVTPHVLSRVLNHSPGRSEGITSVYNRYAYEREKRHALDLWGAHVERIVSGSDGTKVVPLSA